MRSRKRRKAPDKNASHKRIRARARAMALRQVVEYLNNLTFEPWLPRGMRIAPKGSEYAKAHGGGIREARGLLERRARQYGKQVRA